MFTFAIKIHVLIFTLQLICLSGGQKQLLLDALTERFVLLNAVTSKTCQDLCECRYGAINVNITSKLDQLQPAQATNRPNISWPASCDLRYTLMMIDVDAPSRSMPASKSGDTVWIHSLTLNVPYVPPDRPGHVAATYDPPTPPPNTGLHRYIMLVFEQQDYIDDADLVTLNFPPRTSSRGKFNTQNFTRTYNLLPDPVACNMFEAQNI